jgi:hypothetical protein
LFIFIDLFTTKSCFETVYVTNVEIYGSQEVVGFGSCGSHVFRRHFVKVFLSHMGKDRKLPGHMFSNKLAFTQTSNPAKKDIFVTSNSRRLGFGIGTMEFEGGMGHGRIE